MLFINKIFPLSGVGGGGDLPPDFKYVTALELTIDPQTFVITGKLIDQNGDVVGTTQTIDLPFPLTGNTAPTIATEAAYVGQIYVNTTNNFIYVCTAITTSGNVTTYTWMSPSPLTFTDVIVEES